MCDKVLIVEIVMKNPPNKNIINYQILPPKSASKLVLPLFLE